MTIQEELLREIIELLKDFTIVGAVMLFCIYCLFMGIAFYIFANERKKRKKNTADKQSAVDEDNHLQTQ